MPHTPDLLFPPGCTHIEVRCWSCGHTVELRPDQVQAGLTQHDFERRAKCRCGVGWPQVARFPKVVKTW